MAVLAGIWILTASSLLLPKCDQTHWWVWAPPAVDSCEIKWLIFSYRTLTVHSILSIFHKSRNEPLSIESYPSLMEKHLTISSDKLIDISTSSLDRKRLYSERHICLFHLFPYSSLSFSRRSLATLLSFLFYKLAYLIYGPEPPHLPSPSLGTIYFQICAGLLSSHQAFVSLYITTSEKPSLTAFAKMTLMLSGS